MSFIATADERRVLNTIDASLVPLFMLSDVMARRPASVTSPSLSCELAGTIQHLEREWDLVGRNVAAGNGFACDLLAPFANVFGLLHALAWARLAPGLDTHGFELCGMSEEVAHGIIAIAELIADARALLNGAEPKSRTPTTTLDPQLHQDPPLILAHGTVRAPEAAGGGA